jgi:aryl-alcohol dehydrogenase-like predicted oxidoreductase
MKAKNGATRLGFGCTAIPGPLSTREALALLDAAYACGIRHFDTARMYCSGDSERVLGEFVRQHREEVTLVTKAGLAPATALTRGLNKVATAFRLKQAAPWRRSFEPDQIRRSVETSLRELKADHIDALLLHEIMADEVQDELKRLLERFRSEGKIGAYGIATSIEESEALIADHPELCEIVQVSAAWLDQPRPLPKNARLIIHSVLRSRLGSFLTRLKTDDVVARAFKGETGFAATDAGQIGRLMLQAAMHRNPDGVTLFSTSRAERIRRNAKSLTGELDIPAINALERAMRAPANVERKRNVAP